jgi:phytoene/squalene synthetase
MNSQQLEFLEIHNLIDFHKIKDHPNILIAANFWEPERFGAAKTCYKFMRTIDDLIDNYKAKNRIIEPGERNKFEKDVDEWLKLIIGSEDFNPARSELIDTIEKFNIPRWPLEAFAKAMIYDINNDGFPTLASFLEYSQGASVAPASIFVHLTGLTSKNGRYHNPGFDVKEAATPCAIFSYLVHIIRDFQKDLFNNLNYFADDLMIKNGLTREELRNIAHGGPISHGFRNMIREYYAIADEYRQLTFEVIRNISPLVEPRYKLSLEIIFSLYLMVFERIDIENGSFTTIELNPTPEETKKRVYETIMGLEF